MFSWLSGKTVNEEKRDDYQKLYNKLQKIIDKHDRKVSDAQSSYRSYVGAIPYLSSYKVPSNDFGPKRIELNKELNQYFTYEKDKRTQLITAKDKAYERYLHYKSLAIQEAEKE
jgi:hypothetical protein